MSVLLEAVLICEFEDYSPQRTFQTNQNRFLVLVERAAGGHVVYLVPDSLKNLGIFLSTFCGETVDNVRILGDCGEDCVNELDDLGHVLLHKST